MTVSILGDTDADFPPEAISFANGIATISGILFSRATAANEKFTIKVQTEDRTLRAEKEVTVVPETIVTTLEWNTGSWGACTNNVQSRNVTCRDHT